MNGKEEEKPKPPPRSRRRQSPPQTPVEGLTKRWSVLPEGAQRQFTNDQLREVALEDFRVESWYAKKLIGEFYWSQLDSEIIEKNETSPDHG